MYMFRLMCAVIVAEAIALGFWYAISHYFPLGEPWGMIVGIITGGTIGMATMVIAEPWRARQR